MSEKIPHESLSSFTQFNIGFFLLYTVGGSILTGQIEIISFLLPFHFILIAVSLLFGALFDKSPGKVFGYIILFLLILGIIGFSICVGAIRFH